jgi:glycine oxidase
MVGTERGGEPPSERCDVAIAGGGVIGLSCAWALSRAGHRVAVIDPEPGRGAAWVAAGMLAPANEAFFGEEALVRLLGAGAQLWPAFAAALEGAVGRPIGFEPSGTVVVACDPSDRAALDRLLEFRRSIGVESRRLAASECRRLIPALSPSICGGAEVPGDHQVDNRLLVGALLEACRGAGVDFVTSRVAQVVVDPSGRARGLQTTDGVVIAADAVVAAMGWQTPFLGGLPQGVLPEVRPVKGHILRLAGGARLLERTVRGLVRGRTCYLVPRQDNSLVVGATVEEMGPDMRVQAGAVHSLLDDARALVPGVDELELSECSVGLRPGTPDNAPRVGWTQIDRLAVATGHYRNGILLAPITAAAIVAVIDGSEVPAELRSFAPAGALQPPGGREASRP